MSKELAVEETLEHVKVVNGRVIRWETSNSVAFLKTGNTYNGCVIRWQTSNSMAFLKTGDTYNFILI